MRNIQRTIAVLPFALLAVALIAAGVSAVNAQESDDAPPGVSVRQSDTATSTPIAIGPPDHVAGQSAATAPDTPARPRRLKDADITTTSIRISWAAPSDNGSPITGYTVRYQDRDGGGAGVAGPWSEVSASASSTSKVVSGLSPATRYNFEIKAANGVGDSAWSPNRYGHTKPGRISTPSLTAGNGSLDVIWSAPSGGTAIESYQVRHKLTSASTWTSAGSSTTSPFTITGLTNGSPYHVQVRACNRMLFVGGVGDNCGAWSSSATGTPQTVAPPALYPPPAPSSFSGTPDKTSVALSWTALTGASRYRLSGGNLSNVEVTGTSRTDTGLTCGTEYTYTIQAFGNGTDYLADWGGAATTTVTISDCEPPPAPSGFSGTPYKTSVALRWNALTGASRYRLNGGNLSNVEVTGTSRTDTGLTCETEYTYTIQAQGNNTDYAPEWGAAATETATTSGCDPPYTVTDFRGTATRASVTLQWTPGSGVSTYEITRLTFGEHYLVLTSSETGATYTDDGVDCGTDHTYRIRALGDGLSRPADYGPYTTLDISAADCEPCAEHNLVTPVDADNVVDYNRMTKPISKRPWTEMYSTGDDYPDMKCKSPFRSTVFGVVYKFKLEKTTHLRIWVQSHTGADPYVTVGTDSSILSENDTSDEHRAPDAEVARLFPRGDYTISVTAVGQLPSGANFSLAVIAQEPMPSLGHQSDHTVQYALGIDPAPIGGFMDPWGHVQDVLREATFKAAGWWNDAFSGWPNILFCEGSCSNRGFSDGITVTVRIAGEADCVTGIACVYPTKNSRGHVTSDEVLFEHPTETENPEDDNMYPVRWVGRFNVDRKVEDVELPDGTTVEMFMVYAPSVMMHEFGHILGMDDLRRELWGIGFMMAEAQKRIRVPDKDKEYIRQLYRNEHGGKPHGH